MSAFEGPSIIKSNLLLYYDAGNTKSYPGSGTTWTDLSGNSRNGTLTNGPTYNSSNGGSFIFDGSNDYVALPTSVAFGTSTFTIECWVNANSLSGIDVIYASASSNANGHIALGHYSAGYEGYGKGFFLADFNGSTRQITSIGSVATINTWYHLVGLRNASNQYVVYVNTVATTTNAASTLNITSPDPRIGVNPASFGEIWDGKIANFKLYNRELTVTEIKQNFYAQRGRFGV